MRFHVRLLQNCLALTSNSIANQLNNGIGTLIPLVRPPSLLGRAGFNCRRCCSNVNTSENIPDSNSLTCDTSTMSLKVLNVAEKNDAAKRIAGLLSGGTARVSNSPSIYNKLYEFPYNFMGRAATMTMTSVSGHLLNHEFGNQHRSWQSIEPVMLFDVPVIKGCPPNFLDCKRNLEQQSAYCHYLIIWTDCDREGENIGFEIIDVCKAINPRLKVLRAKFSEITPTAIRHAISNPIQPNKFISDAVDTRSELDLRIGAAFTRFQTMRLQRRYPDILSNHVISYGSCQFPTLGFVVERYKAIQDFVPEDFWKIEVSLTVDNSRVDFNWARVRLFNELASRVLYERCADNPQATVTKVASKPKSKWRPVALDTVEFEKLSSRKLRISAKDAMKIAEKLYMAGNISYPRTETNIFPKGLELRPLVQMQASQAVPWGDFAQRLLTQGPNPRNGKKSDQAHPPIHPTKLATDLSGNDARVYELIVRHFLACCSKDAVGKETTIDIDIADEKFVTHGLIILERNYLEVYPYDKWSDKELPNFEMNQTFIPSRIEMASNQTSPPNLLTEADLISLMEKHGIGTDATHAEHIEKIKTRMYVGLQGDKFVPGQLGMGLVEGYDAMGFQMSKPHLRAELEADLKRICDGLKSPQVVLQEQVASYKAVFIEAMQQVNKLDESIAHFLNRAPGGGGSGQWNSGGGNGGNGPGGGGNNGPGTGGSGPGSGGSGPGGGGHGHGRGGPPPGGNRGPGAGNSGPSSRTVTPGNFGMGPPPPSGRGQFGSSTRRGNNDDGEDDGAGSGRVPLCGCGIEAASRIARKEGPNCGRSFFTCGNGTCGFFEWNDSGNQSAPPNRSQQRAPVQTSTYSNSSSYPDRGHTSSSTTSNRNNANDNGEDENGFPMCNCGVRAAPLTVKKDNANKGKSFFGCGRGVQSSCGFFKWDEEGLGQRTIPVSAPRGRGRGSRGGQRPQTQRSPSTGQTPKKRRPPRCAICNTTGHTRRTCPSRDFEDEEDLQLDGVF